MKIYIGCDHGGLNLKNYLKDYLKEKNINVIDVGTNTTESCNYPDFAKAVCKRVLEEKELGILVCGTGVGISIAANKHKGIRAVVCSEPFSAKLSKQHNNTNVLCLGERVVGVELATMIVDEWLNASFEGGRHQTRVSLITDIEEEN